MLLLVRIGGYCVFWLGLPLLVLDDRLLEVGDQVGVDLLHPVYFAELTGWLPDFVSFASFTADLFDRGRGRHLGLLLPRSAAFLREKAQLGGERLATCSSLRALCPLDFHFEKWDLIL